MPRPPSSKRKTDALIASEPQAEYGGRSARTPLRRNWLNRSSAEVIAAVRAGILREDAKEIANWLGVAEAHARVTLRVDVGSSAPRLTQDEGERVVRFARLRELAEDVVGSEDAARAWLLAPQRGLGGAIPLDHASTEIGAREVEDLLWRIGNGVIT